MNLLRWVFFELRYLAGRPPWDTGITPPELLAFLEAHPPGRALDIGCGTGTNGLAMARLGWEVTGVDFSWAAILRARRRARRADLAVDFRRGDVTALTHLPGGFDLAVDIGCLHSLDIQSRDTYADVLAKVVRPGGTFLLYAFVHPPDSPTTRGVTETEIGGRFGPAFATHAVQHGTDRQRPSAWFTLRRAT
jgi:SAM-dependent methyltransferase